MNKIQQQTRKPTRHNITNNTAISNDSNKGYGGMNYPLPPKRTCRKLSYAGINGKAQAPTAHTRGKMTHISEEKCVTMNSWGYSA